MVLRVYLVALLRTFLLCIAFTFITVLGYTQPTDPQGGTKPGDDVPITGIEILIGLGGMLGIKKIHDLRKKR